MQKASLLATAVACVTALTLGPGANANSSPTRTGVTVLAKQAPALGRNALAPCKLDSFVRSAGGQAQLIYGDETIRRGVEKGGDTTVPPTPYNGFSSDHRIGSGFDNTTMIGLTTGNGSYMPSAWGRDEFLGAEYNMSAPQLQSVNNAAVAVEQTVLNDAAPVITSTDSGF